MMSIRQTLADLVNEENIGNSGLYGRYRAEAIQFVKFRRGAAEVEVHYDVPETANWALPDGTWSTVVPSEELLNAIVNALILEEALKEEEEER